MRTIAPPLYQGDTALRFAYPRHFKPLSRESSKNYARNMPLEFPVRRSILITPGHAAARLAKAATLDVDAVAFDIEDGVPPEMKDDARAAIAEALRALDFGGRERIVRVNAIGAGALEQDLAALPLERVDTLFIPKVADAAAVAALDTRLGAIEAAAGLPRRIPLILTIETGEGLFNVAEIARASDRTTALFFGSGDYAAETGCRITPETLQVPRALIAAAAGMAGIQAIDAAYFLDVKDAEATRADAERARDFGFSGKLLFHPNQIAATNAVFTPDPAAVARAEKIIAAYEDAKARGEGTAVADGEFIAIDMLPPARRVLAVARHAGVIAANRRD